jgi:lipoate-protein ligase B
VNTDMSYFELIRPCGLDPSTMTSMQKVAGKRFDMADVKNQVVREYAAAKGEDFVSQDVAQPLLGKH